VTAPKQDKGPLGHAFEPSHTFPEKCRHGLGMGELGCGQPASAHKAEEQVPERRTIVHQGPLDASRRFYSSAPEPVDKAGAEATARAIANMLHDNYCVQECRWHNKPGEEEKGFVEIRDAILAAEAAARKEEFERLYGKIVQRISADIGGNFDAALDQLAYNAKADEREKCAKIAEHWWATPGHSSTPARALNALADAIRARNVMTNPRDPVKVPRCGLLRRWWHRRKRNADWSFMAEAIVMSAPNLDAARWAWNDFIQSEGQEHWRCECGREVTP